MWLGLPVLYPVVGLSACSLPALPQPPGLRGCLWNQPLAAQVLLSPWLLPLPSHFSAEPWAEGTVTAAPDSSPSRGSLLPPPWVRWRAVEGWARTVPQSGEQAHQGAQKVTWGGPNLQGAEAVWEVTFSCQKDYLFLRLTHGL